MTTKRKVVLITGTSSGIGMHTAVEFSKANYQVYATMRDLGKSDQLRMLLEEEKVDAKLLELDVQSNDSIARAVDQIIKIDQRIDVLINNAGQGFMKPLEQATEADAINLFDVNFHGHNRLIKFVLPRMRASGVGHIVGLTSIAGLVGYPLSELYCATKFALEGYYESLASYMSYYFNIKVTIVEPGPVASEFMNNIILRLNESGEVKNDDYWPVIQDYLKVERADKDFTMQPASEVAKIILECCNSPDPPVRLRTSRWAEEFCKIKTAGDPDGKKSIKNVLKVLLGV